MVVNFCTWEFLKIGIGTNKKIGKTSSCGNSNTIEPELEIFPNSPRNLTITWNEDAILAFKFKHQFHSVNH